MTQSRQQVSILGFRPLLGFALLLALDFWFWNEGLAPVWWMRFRLLLSVVVLASLAAAL